MWRIARGSDHNNEQGRVFHDDKLTFPHRNLLATMYTNFAPGSQDAIDEDDEDDIY
jgi:hypothetical protein